MRAKYTVEGRGADGTPKTLFSGTTAGDMIFDASANAIVAVVREFQYATEADEWTKITLIIIRHASEVPA